VPDKRGYRKVESAQERLSGNAQSTSSPSWVPLSPYVSEQRVAREVLA